MRLLSPLLIKGSAMASTETSLQKKLEDAIEWSALNRGKLLTGVLAATAILFACSFLWHTIATSGQTPLEGLVSLDGKPIRYGTVTIVTEDRQIFTTTISPDGTYRFPSVKPGRFRVAVSSPNPKSIFERRTTDGSGRMQAQPKARTQPKSSQPSTRQDKGDSSTSSGLTTVAVPTSMPPPKPISQTAQQKLWTPIPGRYANPRTSGLTIESTGAGATHELKLETAKQNEGDQSTDR